MEYLPTLGEKWRHSRGNVGKYTIHGSFGLRVAIKNKHLHFLHFVNGGAKNKNTYRFQVFFK